MIYVHFFTFFTFPITSSSFTTWACGERDDEDNKDDVAAAHNDDLTK
jgi:hypothetical protein